MRTSGHEAHVSAEPCAASSGPRIPGADEDARGARHPQAASGQGSQAPRGLEPLEARVSLGAERLRREDRLRKAREFRDVSGDARRRASPRFVVLAAPARRAVSASRLGLAVSRRVGRGVVRNRVKRRVREWFRRGGRERLGGRVDLVVIARSPAAQLGGREVARELDRLCQGLALAGREEGRR